jgi:hypothetical protein
VQDDLRPIILRGEDLDQRGPFGHDDSGLDAEAPAVIGDGLGVVPRRGGDDPPGSIGKRKAQEFVKGAALFERTGHLEVLELEKRLTAAELAQLLRVDQGCAEDLVVNGQIGFFDVELGDQFNPLKDIHHRGHRAHRDNWISNDVSKKPLVWCLNFSISSLNYNSVFSVPSVVKC